MTVLIIGWSGRPTPGGGRSAVAAVDGVRVRVRRSLYKVRWLCDDHGAENYPHCPHLRALADEPADPTKRNHS
ncbi:hypothetical protein [Pedococcus bigeumensis]|uniref:SWIM-type domain-containing protein n=1 Tax=Pedococcus bigeumensis TaxID=433644 RepID=A0A502CIT8_9MICO|nr:hypothetical protein [Pedococcus bigeumensis]TPG12560.1 hypothetical protein EAH86_19845 [Pedococcus bigeumensis]